MPDNPSPKPKRPINPQDHLDEINRQPLNQEALRWLKVANTEHDPTLGPYLFQLMFWGLESGAVRFRPEFHGLVKVAVEKLLVSDPPQQALDYLLHDPDDPHAPPMKVEDLSQHRSPKQVATYLLQYLDQRLKSDPKLAGEYQVEPDVAE